MISALTFVLATMVRPISLESPGIRLELFLQEVSQKSGERMTCDPALSNEVLVASFSNVEPQVLRQRLSEILRASWTQSSDGYRLAQTKDEASADIALNHEARRQQFMIGVQHWAAINTNASLTKEEIAQDYEIQRKAMGGQKLTKEELHLYTTVRDRRPIGRIASDICRIANFESLDFDSLSNERLDLIPSDLAKMGLTADVLKRLTEKFTQEEDMADAAIGGGRVAFHSEGPFTLKFSMIPDLTFNIHVTAVDKTGKHHASTAFSGEDWRSFLPDQELFRVSEFTNTIGQVIESSRPSGRGYGGKDLATKYSQSTKWFDLYFGKAKTYDPLGLYDGQCWLDFARARRQPLLASLEEEEANGRQPQRRVPALKQAHVTIGMTRVDADGWILGRPVNPWRNRVSRPDRGLVEKAWQMARNYEEGDIDRTADLYFQMSQPIPYHSLIFRGKTQRQLGLIYGALPSELRKRSHWSPLSLEDLPSAARSICESHVKYRQWNRMFRDDPRWLSDDPPKNYFPNGIKGCKFSCPINQEWVFDSDGKLYSLDQIASEVQNATLEHIPVDKDWKYRIGHREVAHPTITLGSRSISESIFGRVGAMSKLTTWWELPRGLREAILARSKTVSIEDLVDLK